MTSMRQYTTGSWESAGLPGDLEESKGLPGASGEFGELLGMTG